uniref:protein SPIRAL1-like 5 n=1 Tax=Erigeron canadensis TaxID=72917 RepID=UPI001CB8F4D8|nr:protein SPIRAL1-like 5 [Erigeron canadensis]
MNKRNNHSGGGQSSLGYLFGFDELGRQQQKDQPTTVSSSPPTVSIPPYGTDDDIVKEKSPPEKAPTPTKKQDDSTTSSSKFIYHGDGQKSRDVLVTGRPSTKVRSVPGGDSSLGYLFGDK